MSCRAALMAACSLTVMGATLPTSSTTCAHTRCAHAVCGRPERLQGPQGLVGRECPWHIPLLPVPPPFSHAALLVALLALLLVALPLPILQGANLLISLSLLPLPPPLTYKAPS
jgi:hypothetical protein